MCIIAAGVNASCSALLKRKSWENSKYQGNMIESIFNISQSLTAVDFPKSYMFRQDFWLPEFSCSPNYNIPVRLTIKFYLQCHILLPSLRMGLCSLYLKNQGPCIYCSNTCKLVWWGVVCGAVRMHLHGIRNHAHGDSGVDGCCGGVTYVE